MVATTQEESKWGASCSHVVALSRASDRHVSMFAEEVVDLFSMDRPVNEEVKYLLLKDRDKHEEGSSHKNIANYW
jgi:hypothetical protein